ncbi:hypothetical protein [Bacteriovorax sp. BAL6_X]|uniref:hypothetical protein n=1 Tax=Bacteriovorax sp. BAL6_X TaxID=1201290 RepID=UPI00041DB36A|nr:hypothetical protein [Bacteriovorax sp. BAL6_X]
MFAALAPQSLANKLFQQAGFKPGFYIQDEWYVHEGRIREWTVVSGAKDGKVIAKEKRHFSFAKVSKGTTY